MDVWLQWLAGSVNLEEGYPDQLCIPKAGGLQLLNNRNCPPPTVCNDFEQTREGNPDSYLPVDEAKAVSKCVCPGSQRFVHFSEKVKKKLGGVLNLAEVLIPANSVLAGHAYAQHDGATWNRVHRRWYHICVTPGGADSKDAGAFVYCE